MPIAEARSIDRQEISVRMAGAGVKPGKASTPGSIERHPSRLASRRLIPATSCIASSLPTGGTTRTCRCRRSRSARVQRATRCRRAALTPSFPPQRKRQAGKEAPRTAVRTRRTGPSTSRCLLGCRPPYGYRLAQRRFPIRAGTAALTARLPGEISRCVAALKGVPGQAFT